jgi:hypothetical protein
MNREVFPGRKTHVDISAKAQIPMKSAMRLPKTHQSLWSRSNRFWVIITVINLYKWQLTGYMNDWKQIVSTGRNYAYEWFTFCLPSPESGSGTAEEWGHTYTRFKGSASCHHLSAWLSMSSSRTQMNHWVIIGWNGLLLRRSGVWSCNRNVAIDYILDGCFKRIDAGRHLVH